MEISKSQFKPRALEFMRQVQHSGEPIVITDHGVPVLELRPYRAERTGENAMDYFKGTVLSYDEPTEPVADDDWSTL